MRAAGTRRSRLLAPVRVRKVPWRAGRLAAIAAKSHSSRTGRELTQNQTVTDSARAKNSVASDESRSGFGTWACTRSGAIARFDHLERPQICPEKNYVKKC